MGDGDMAKELVQLLIVTDSELKMTGDDTGLLVVTSGVTGQLKQLDIREQRRGRQEHLKA